jgi:ABC-type transport system involved in multi-copper enzyme maturation permease subunit
MMDKKSELKSLIITKVAENKIYFIVLKNFELLSEQTMVYRGAIILKSSFNYTDDNDTMDINVLYSNDDIPLTYFTGISIISYDLIVELVLNKTLQVFNARSKGKNREIIDLLDLEDD